MPTRTRLPTDERRQQLLDLGLELFSAKSYEHVEVADIAARAGVSKGLLYHYFGSKGDFYAAVVERAAGILLEAVRTPETLIGLERARAGIEAYLSYVVDRAEAYLALMHGGLGADPRVLAIVDRTRAAIVAQMLEGLGLDEPPPVFRVAGRSWLGAVEAASLDWLRHRDVSRAQLVDLMIASLTVHIGVAIRATPDVDVQSDPAGVAMLVELLTGSASQSP